MVVVVVVVVIGLHHHHHHHHHHLVPVKDTDGIEEKEERIRKVHCFDVSLPPPSLQFFSE